MSRPCIHPVQPSTPPPRYSPSASYSMSTSSSYFSPASPTRPARSAREIIMGGLVSRPASTREPRDPRDPGEWDADEKSSGSIEVPGIVLTEPHEQDVDLPPQSPSPPTKSIMLLPPASLPIPTDLPAPATHRSCSPSPWTMLGNRRGAPGTVARTVVLLGALGLAAWHLWVTGGVADLVEDAVADAW